MATPITPVPAPSGFWASLKQLLPAIELAGNVALLASPLAGFEPLVAGLENATQSAVQAIGTPQTASSALMTIYATIIAVLTILKQQPGLPAATLSKVDEYIAAAEAGTGAYFAAASGFSAANYAPVAPIV
jgi:hypothetical protein